MSTFRPQKVIHKQRTVEKLKHDIFLFDNKPKGHFPGSHMNKNVKSKSFIQLGDPFGQ